MALARSVVALVLFMSGLCALPARAAPEPLAALLQPLEWRSIGPFRGGRVLAVAGVPGEPHHFYFGAVNGGVWETRDAGRTWEPIFDSAPVGSIGALAVAPSDSHVIYVGTGEADMRSDIAQGTGLYRSRDAGRSWQAVGLEDSQQIGRILVDPANPDVVLVAALGHPYGPSETRGVFRSTDGGASWRRTLYLDADTGAIDLAFEPGNARVAYASLWQTRRPPWNVYPPSSGPGGGLYQSHDGGETWAQLTGRGLPAHPGRIGIGVAPSRRERVYALVDAAEGGLYRSDDAGASWTRVSDDPRIWKRGWYFGGVTVDPVDADVVYICNTGVHRSTDGGRKFSAMKGAPGGDDYHALWIDPHDSQRRILGVDQGAVVTLNGGATWSSWFNQPTGQFYHVITDSRFPYWVYGAQQDSGAAAVPSRTDNIDGINLTEFRESAVGGESDNLAPDPVDPQIIFGGRVDRFDTRTGQKQSVPPTLAYPGLYRGTWTLPLVFGKPEPHALYFGTQRIFRTTDRGAHWQPISPDLTREDPGTPANLDAAAVADNDSNGPRRGVVYAIGPSPLNAALLWAGTDDGLLWKTVDGGAHWKGVTPGALTAWSKIGVVEPSHFDAGGAYIAVDRHRLDDPRPYIYRTHDGGASWTLIVEGLTDGGVHNSVNVVREDPVHRGLLYCGTEHGVYVSLDDGAHWHALQQNLPRTSVRDLEVHGTDLVIATHGRGFWIMDDIAPLRTFADEAVAGGTPGGTRVLPPAPAVRVRPTGFTGSPMPKDEPRGANPAPGAYIDYVLDPAVTGTVGLSIYDARGVLVHAFASDDQPPQPDPSKVVIAPEWIVAPQPLGTGAGAHRFVWDLHYAPRAGLISEDPDDPEAGVWAPPGEYRVELKAGGGLYRQTLTVAPDPRVALPPSAYAQQFALARDIEGARVEVAAALAAAERIHATIAARRKDATGAAAAALAAADRQLLSISDLEPVKRSPDSIGRPPTTTAGLRYLATAFHNLERAVDGADAAPTIDAERGYLRHRALLDHALADWAHFTGSGLPGLNAQLEASGAAAVAP
ncbi:MAG TPA: hypothetical protein VNV40_05470 [Steroidobacteraceae bacterium]|nr:hypothetical protein [Steroidobacteraceae bacterium]